MRQCQCGGLFRSHELTGYREAWLCNQCGRYGIIQRQSNNPYEQSEIKEFDLPETLDYARGNERECSQ